MFEVNSSKKIYHANELKKIYKSRIKNSFPYVVRATQNNGIRGYIKEDEIYANEKNTLSFAQDTFSVFYQKEKYFTGNKVKVLKPLFNKKSDNIMQYMVACFQKSLCSFSWGVGSTVETILDTKIQLPTKNNEIDFDFMESFIAELKAQRIAELTAYLTVSGLDNYELTEDEQKVLEDFKNNKIEYSEFTYKYIFNNIQQGQRLKKSDQLSGNIPFVMAGVTNNGVANYVSNPVASFPKNSITIDIFGNAFYRNYDFGAGDDTGVYWNNEIRYTEKVMLFFTTAMEKSIKGKYSYGKKLRSSQSLNFKMQLPTKNNQPDYKVMDTFISAIQKLVIKDVVLYADRQIAATEKAIK